MTTTPDPVPGGDEPWDPNITWPDEPVPLPMEGDDDD